MEVAGAAGEQQNATGLPADPKDADGLADATFRSAEWAARRQLNEQLRRSFEYS
jgi:hypothetical protein